MRAVCRRFARQEPPRGGFTRLFAPRLLSSGGPKKPVSPTDEDKPKTFGKVVAGDEGAPAQVLHSATAGRYEYIADFMKSMDRGPVKLSFGERAPTAKEMEQVRALATSSGLTCLATHPLATHPLATHPLATHPLATHPLATVAARSARESTAGDEAFDDARDTRCCGWGLLGLVAEQEGGFSSHVTGLDSSGCMRAPHPGAFLCAGSGSEGRKGVFGEDAGEDAKSFWRDGRFGRWPQARAACASALTAANAHPPSQHHSCRLPLSDSKSGLPLLAMRFPRMKN